MSPAEQRTRALELANRIRSDRAQLKRKIRSGSIDARKLVLDPPASIQSMRVDKFLLARHYCGPVKVRRMLTRANLEPTRAIGELSHAQKQRLVWVMG